MTARIVISLDFELRWGMQHKLGTDLAHYRANLEGVRDVVPAMLEMFARYGVTATWAFVGAIACESWDEYEHRAPAWPAYTDPGLAWHPEIRRLDPAGKLYFAPELVDAILTARQELGSHSFSHVPMGEPGFQRKDSIADTDAVLKLFADRWQLKPKSFVFPRNQIAFTDVLQRAGFRIWRTNPKPPFWSFSASTERSFVMRALRLTDALVPLGTRSVEPDDHRASHFIRFTLPDPVWRLHQHRVIDEARRLAPHRVLHLWWHPHNLGVETQRRLRRLEELLERLRDAAPPGTRFTSMEDLVASG